MPDTVFDYRTIYRTVVSDGRPERWGYGYVAKGDGRSDYTDRITDDFVLVYALRGSGTFTDGNERNGAAHAVAPGDALVHWPRRACSLSVVPDGRWVEQWLVAPAWFAQAMHLLRILDPARTVLPIGVNSAISRSLHRIGETLESMDDADADMFSLRVHELLVEIVRLTRDRPDDRKEVELVLAACRRLADRVAEPLSIPALANSLGVGYELFRKVFRRRIGLAPGEYRIHRRVDRARELIVHQRLSNREVAEALGYADAFVFSKQFKRIAGESPTAFRRRMT